MKEINAILNSFVTDKKVEILKNDYWDKTNKCSYKFGAGWNNTNRGTWETIGAYSFDEAFIFRPFLEGEHNKLTPTFIPSDFHNKKFVIGDFEITVQHEQKITHNDDSKHERSYKRVYHHIENQWNVILKYHGCYNLIGKFKNSYRINGWHCLPTCSNWYHIKQTVDKPYMLDEAAMSYDYECWDKVEKIFQLLKISELTLEDSIIPFQDWYIHSQKERKTKSIAQLSLDEKDIEWFIKSETKDGIYKPEKSTIDRLLFTTDGYSYYDIKMSNKINKKLLSELGIHTIQLRSDSHYDVPKYFDLKGIKIKAPQKVIEKYSMEKYCIDDKMVVEIKEKQKKEKEKQKTLEANNKFTLMQHGKVILDTKDKERIIEYLENFSPTCNDIEDDVIACVKPIFDNFPKVERLYIAYWGRYFKYESRGEICDITYCIETDNNSENISEEDWEQIVTLYEENLCPTLDDKLVENKWGWEERGGTIMGVEKGKKGKLQVFTEEYDFE